MYGALSYLSYLWNLDKHERKVVRDAWKSLTGGAKASHKRGDFPIGKTGSYYVMLLHCQTLLQILLGIYWKRFYLIPLLTTLLLFYVFEFGKAKNSKCPNNATTERAILKIFVSFLLTLGNSRQNRASPLETPYNCVTPSRNFRA